jgi:hypothetical protein
VFGSAIAVLAVAVAAAIGDEQDMERAGLEPETAG